MEFFWDFSLNSSHKYKTIFSLTFLNTLRTQQLLGLEVKEGAGGFAIPISCFAMNSGHLSLLTEIFIIKLNETVLGEGERFIIQGLNLHRYIYKSSLSCTTASCLMRTEIWHITPHQEGSYNFNWCNHEVYFYFINSSKWFWIVFLLIVQIFLWTELQNFSNYFIFILPLVWMLMWNTDRMCPLTV